MVTKGKKGWGEIRSVGLIDVCMYAQSLQSCLTLCNPLDCSLQGSSVHGIVQARILEWVAMPFSHRCILLYIK